MGLLLVICQQFRSVYSQILAIPGFQNTFEKTLNSDFSSQKISATIDQGDLTEWSCLKAPGKAVKVVYHIELGLNKLTDTRELKLSKIKNSLRFFWIRLFQPKTHHEQIPREKDKFIAKHTCFIVKFHFNNKLSKKYLKTSDKKAVSLAI